MCSKQCRDENGFKCHIMSESHQRQLLLCAEDPTKFQDEFSNQFLSDFLGLLRRRWGTKRVCSYKYKKNVFEKALNINFHIFNSFAKCVTVKSSIFVKIFFPNFGEKLRNLAKNGQNLAELIKPENSWLNVCKF